METIDKTQPTVTGPELWSELAKQAHRNNVDYVLTTEPLPTVDGDAFTMTFEGAN